MILIEEVPVFPTVAKYVDRYQLFITKEPIFFKTIPNGKIECYFVKQGEFSRWDFETESFILSDTSGILPATNKATFYHIPGNTICLNIKFKLTIISVSLFKELLTNWQGFKLTELIPTVEQKNILSDITGENPIIPVHQLDIIIENCLDRYHVDLKIDKVIQLIKGQITDQLRVVDLADKMNMSPKSMERWIKKQFNLSPKELLQVMRFEHVSYELKNQPNSKLVDSITYGYYDQSHFIKECRKITGYSPKIFFSKMELPTNDIIIE
ncbi:helix-turn-helix domain-containing protein [Aquimarina litoralis]|uniref:helix-turn-helix domain-containing protein n=1 Tax=Aquimarina litoralis TaxID=584605 RepID=UPI001C58D227|nr:helix-turn-helix transcriptional regulator [Aquimarina litoralis]MBW1294849.1 helix-turn-helix domain-containing protein [Aquimarina litoralis]